MHNLYLALEQFDILNVMKWHNELTHLNKSHRKQVVIPQPSNDLAEFIGIMLGDGGIHTPWQATITVNWLADKDYADYIANLCYSLFHIRPSIYKRKTRNAAVIRLSSTAVVEYLIKLGLHRGNKLRQGLVIPEWIMRRRSYRLACIRGLVDTDGCIFVHKHKIKGREYRNIGLTFTSYSPRLIEQVAEILAEVKIIPHITERQRDIYLYRADAVSRYLRLIGTSNPRIDSVYDTWKGG